MNKLYLCGMTSSGNIENLKEMIEPIKEYFDGLNFTFHYPKDGGAAYLEDNKKDGKIVYAEWCQRHEYSLNHFLYQGNMQNGDYFVLLDSLERITVEFASKALPDFIKQMKQNNICMVSNYGKGFLFRYDESLNFKGSPHWYITNYTGGIINVELPQTLFYNIRGQKRDKFHFINHYGKYMLYPYGSNHALLGLEKNGDPKELFPRREERRLEFREYLRNELNIPLNIESLKSYLIENKDNLPVRLKYFINNEKVWNDLYRFYCLNDRNIVDNHDHKDMVQI